MFWRTCSKRVLKKEGLVLGTWMGIRQAPTALPDVLCKRLWEATLPPVGLPPPAGRDEVM